MMRGPFLGQAKAAGDPLSIAAAAARDGGCGQGEDDADRGDQPHRGIADCPVCVALVLWAAIVGLGQAIGAFVRELRAGTLDLGIPFGLLLVALLVAHCWNVLAGACGRVRR